MIFYDALIFKLKKDHVKVRPNLVFEHYPKF
ncbi:hypothetical protein HDEF_0045 [Candidatus Hamiltonella defensa 5AT (Acyrthosiphon pisum)]|uniref:Uncharacterized protein n=1 Tax=Hamiltonella defensa subsp. Acyrthosiphon pisum (strain 5AT) TaxID=572265 RepID=C4K8I3_HAMD5|nr:hypothetical protein HDEF_0045 [Candidatus Hamiltonella defensa 5AT (Acyrthosiphon pisum)]